MLATHSMPEAEELCDRLAFIQDGRIVADWHGRRAAPGHRLWDPLRAPPASTRRPIRPRCSVAWPACRDHVGAAAPDAHDGATTVVRLTSPRTDALAGLLRALVGAGAASSPARPASCRSRRSTSTRWARRPVRRPPRSARRRPDDGPRAPDACAGAIRCWSRSRLLPARPTDRDELPGRIRPAAREQLVTVLVFFFISHAFGSPRHRARGQRRQLFRVRASSASPCPSSSARRVGDFGGSLRESQTTGTLELMLLSPSRLVVLHDVVVLWLQASAGSGQPPISSLVSSSARTFRDATCRPPSPGCDHDRRFTGLGLLAGAIGHRHQARQPARLG